MSRAHQPDDLTRRGRRAPDHPEHIKRSLAAARATPAAPTALESLEGRALFSVFSLSFHAPLAFSGPTLGLPSPALSLPPAPLALPGPSLALPATDNGAAPVTPVPTPFSRGFDLRGLYRGTAVADADGSNTPIRIDLTRQRQGRVSGTVTVSVDGGDLAIQSTARVLFLGDRRVSFTFANSYSSVTVIARFNRDGTITGRFDGDALGQSLNGTFTMTRLGGAGSGTIVDAG